MMISKVEPLHKKVKETTQAVDDAEHRMANLEKKRKVRVTTGNQFLYTCVLGMLYYVSPLQAHHMSAFCFLRQGHLLTMVRFSLYFLNKHVNHHIYEKFIWEEKAIYYETQ